jgi:hypothetical protein
MPRCIPEMAPKVEHAIILLHGRQNHMRLKCYSEGKVFIGRIRNRGLEVAELLPAVIYIC